MKEKAGDGRIEADAFEKAWLFFESVKKALKTKNRFSNDDLDRLVSRIVNVKAFCYTIPAGSVLYRSRMYSRKDASYRHRFLGEEEAFKGYDSKGSYVNPVSDLVAEGRCNPEYISYLYTSQSVECCIHEMRPNMYSYVSVADIKVKEKLNMLGLDKDEPVRDANEYIVKGVPDSFLMQYLNLAFSSPYEGYGDYLLSQYISEKIKNHGFDGLSFRSAVYDEVGKNTNYVIFNYRKCEAVSSKLYQVKNIRISYD